MQHVHGAIQAYLEHPVPILRRGFEEQLVVEHCGAVEQDVDGAKFRLDLGNHREHIIESGDVGADADRLDARRRKPLGAQAGRICIDVGDCDAHALASHHACRGKTDPGCAAHDQSGLALKSIIHFAVSIPF